MSRISFLSQQIKQWNNTFSMNHMKHSSLLIHTLLHIGIYTFLFIDFDRDKFIEIFRIKSWDKCQIIPGLKSLLIWSGISALEALGMSHTIKISHMDGRRSETIFPVLVNCFIGNFELLTFSHPDYRKHSDTTDNGVLRIQKSLFAASSPNPN